MARSRRDRDKSDEAGRATLAPGQLAVPNVRLTRKIAEGGMGSVWEGEHLALHTTIAVKFVLAEIGDNEEAVTRFEREATAAARIKSPHVVQVLDHGLTENEGVPYIIMELLEGEDLEARLAREPRLPLDLVAHIVTQAAKALGRAHSIGIVHRDIKPSNVFLTDVGGETFVKLLDFGIARLSMTDVGRARVTQTGAMLGTPIFMSPEQMTHAKDVGPGADLWSLGVVAYLAITGRLPFDEETIAGIAMAIERGEYPTPTEIMPQLPGELDDWFAKIFQKDPKKRFASAKEMADALSRIAQVPMPPASVAHTSTPPPPLAPDAEPGPPSLLEAVEDEPTHVEDKGQVAARVAMAAAAAAAAVGAKGPGDRRELGDTEARAKTLQRKTPSSKSDATRDAKSRNEAPAAEVADDADTPSEDIEITTSGLDSPPESDRSDGARSARLPAPVMAKTSGSSTADGGSKGPSTMMGVSGASAVAAPERKSRGVLFFGVALTFAAAVAAGYYFAGPGSARSGATATPSASSPPAAETTEPAPTAPPTAVESAAEPTPSASASASAAGSGSAAASAKAPTPSAKPPSPPAPKSPVQGGASAQPQMQPAPKPADTSTPKAPAQSATPKPAEAPKPPAPAPSH